MEIAQNYLDISCLIIVITLLLTHSFHNLSIKQKKIFITMKIFLINRFLLFKKIIIEIFVNFRKFYILNCSQLLTNVE